jgi:uncharacterized protein (TIGR02145 family)
MWSFKKNIYETRREDSCPDCIANDVIIGTQTWTGCNTTVSTYRDGTSIPYIENSTLWGAATTGAWCYYNNDPTTYAKYGKLYNWYAVTNTLNGGLAPVGYHVPTDTEWTTLTDYLGGNAVAGGKLKQTGLCNWNTPNTGADNSTTFSALGAGYRSGLGALFSNFKTLGLWWSTTEENSATAYFRQAYNNSSSMPRIFNDKKQGLSVRFIKDVCPTCIPQDIPIGTQQIWAKCNAAVATFRDGTLIPQITNPALWMVNTPAWSWYNNDPTTEAEYGKLYNWYAVNDTAHGGLAPVDWRVPDYWDWETLVNYVGGPVTAGAVLKETGTCHWTIPNAGALDTYGFVALPGGSLASAAFQGIKDSGTYWMNTQYAPFFGWLIGFGYNSSTIYIGNNNMQAHFSVRFIKERDCADINIGTQTWTGCNLDVDTYRDGTLIPYEPNAANWATLTTGAWCWYSNNTAFGTKYGKLYNWYAVNDPRGLAPVGYHIPSDAEWTTLTATLGGASSGGGKLKEYGYKHWNTPNTGATNNYNFTALPGGVRQVDGSYTYAGTLGSWWSSTPNGPSSAVGRQMNYNSSVLVVSSSPPVSIGMSIRLVKD